MKQQQGANPDTQASEQRQGVATRDTRKPDARESKREDDAMESNDAELETSDDSPDEDHLGAVDDQPEGEFNDPAAEPGKPI